MYLARLARRDTAASVLVVGHSEVLSVKLSEEVTEELTLVLYFAPPSRLLSLGEAPAIISCRYSTVTLGTLWNDTQRQAVPILPVFFNG